VPARKEAVPLAISVPAFAGRIFDRLGIGYFLAARSEPVGACFLAIAVIAIMRRMAYHPSDIPRTEPHSGHVPASNSRAAPNSWAVMSLGIFMVVVGYLCFGVAFFEREII
jgi:hypothetical protein